MSKRWLSMLLSIVMLLGVLTSCNDNPGTDEPIITDSNTQQETTLPITGPSSTEPPITTEPVTDTPSTKEPSTDTLPLETNPTEEEIVLESNEILLSHFRIICSKTETNSFYQIIQSKAASIKEATDIDLTPTIDANIPEEDIAYEILIGDVDRSIVETAKYELRAKDYMVRYDSASHRILILGGNHATTQQAFNYFFSEWVDLDRKTIRVPEENTYFHTANYPLLSLDINGINLRDYQIVVPEEADLLTYSAGLNVVDFFNAKMGITLPLVSDTELPSPYEFLIGQTNRPESQVSCELKADEYLLLQSENKLILQGNSYMIGGAFGALVRDYLDLTQINLKASWNQLPTVAEARKYVFEEEYNNVILMIGDGMGFNQIEVAKANGLDSFVAELLPHKGEAITRSFSEIYQGAAYTDSAAAATALATGYKTINGFVGKNASLQDVTNVRELAFRYGAQTAIVTTDSITGATPSGFLAHASDRNETLKITRQITNLINAGMVDYCKGGADDKLLHHTRNALVEISDTSAPFFAMIEEAYIDKNCHNASMSGCINTVSRFNTSIAYVIEFILCHPGTALVITADHETGGITKSKGSLEDMTNLISPSILNQKLQGYVKNNIKKYGYSFTAYTGETSCSHTNADVPVYAIGPGTEIFNGVETENIDIARFIAKAYGAETFGQTEELPPRK